MKTKTQFLICLLLCSIFLLPEAMTQNVSEADTTRMPQPVLSDSIELQSILDVKNWFYKIEQDKGLTSNIYLYNISNRKITVTPKKPTLYRLTYNFKYSFGIDPDLYQESGMHDIGISVNPISRDDGFNLHAGGNIGIGKIPTAQPYSSISAYLGGNLEAEYRLNHNFSVFAALKLNYTIARESNLIQSLPDSSYNTHLGLVFDLSAGGRYYLPIKSISNPIFLSATYGLNFYNSHDNNIYPKMYAMVGVGMNSSLSLKNVGRPTWIPVEPSIYLDPLYSNGLISSKIALPIQIMDGLSIAPTLRIGTGYPFFNHNSSRKHNQTNYHLSLSYGIGADIRFFDNIRQQFFNPYIGYNYSILNYSDTAATANSAHNVNIGNLIKLGEKTNWCFDFGVGVSFFKHTESIYNVHSIPVNLHLGLTYKFPMKAKGKKISYKASYKIYQEDHIDSIPYKKELNPIFSEDISADTIVEEHIYIVKTEQQPIKAPEQRPFNIDVSDLKVFKYDYHVTTGLQNLSPNAFRINESNNDTVTIIVVMFDKERCDMDKLSNSNMYLHFNDLINCHYFGYKYDNSFRLQPETKPGTLKLGAEDGYYGKYDNFVKELNWIGTSTIAANTQNLEGSDIENEIFRNFKLYNENLLKNDPNAYVVSTDNYQIAYAIFPSETFAKVDSICDNYGVSVMFRYDFNENGKSSEEAEDKIFIKDNTGTYRTDCEDAAFFSNIVNGKNIYVPELAPFDTTITLNAYKLGDKELPQKYQKVFNTIYDYAKQADSIFIYGYTDHVDFNDKTSYIDTFISAIDSLTKTECKSLQLSLEALYHSDLLPYIQNDTVQYTGDALDVICQRILSWQRASNIVQRLISKNINTDIIRVFAKGYNLPEIKDDNFNDPKSRKVEISLVKYK